MGYQPFLVSNFRTGLNEALDPWLLPAEAFSEVNNFYTYRGQIRKREGSQLLAKFPHYHIDVTDCSAASPAVVTVSTIAGLANGTEIQITGVSGITGINGGPYTITNIGAGPPHTFELLDSSGNQVNTTGAYVSGGEVSIYPGNAIVGLLEWVNNAGDRLLVAADTKRLAFFDTATRVFNPVGTVDVFTGENFEYFHGDGFNNIGTASLTGTLYLTNNVDQIHSFDGTTTTPTFNKPQYTANASDVVDTAQFIFALNHRLILLNTTESDSGGTANYPQRARGSSFDADVSTAADWDQDTPGKGWFVDAPTTERIVAAGRLANAIIVSFTQSVWILAPTPNPALPFRWERVNSTRNIDGPYSAISYDDRIRGIGRPGVIDANTSQVQISAPAIPDFGQEVIRSEFRRMYGGRDQDYDQSWWTYTSFESTAETNDAVLVLNEEDGIWSKYQLPLTVLGVLEDNENPTLQSFGDKVLEDPDIGGMRLIDFAAEIGPRFVGGDLSGNIFLLNNGITDNGSAVSGEITTGDLNPFKDQGFESRLGWVDILVDLDTNGKFTAEAFINDDPEPYATSLIYPLPETNFIGEIFDIGLTNPCTIYIDSHGLATGDVVYLYSIEGATATDDTLNNKSYVVTVVSENTFTLDGVDATSLSAYEGQGIATKEFVDQGRVWKRFYCGNIGNSHRIKLSCDDNFQLVIHALQFSFKGIRGRQSQ